MIDKMEKKRLAILQTLKEANRPVTSSKITADLQAQGHEISERTVRLYLQTLDEEGMTQKFGRRGRGVTEAGLEELASARIIEKVGFLSAKIDQMTYLMNFNLTTRRGTVVINTSVVEPAHIAQYVDKICRVFEKGFAMGRLLTLLEPGERVGGLVIPPGHIGVGTVCSITLNGVLLQHGIPTNSRFGGLLEIQNKKPTRFVEIINYDGTSLDPLEVFIRSGMTNYLGAVEDGNGRIGASFREFPAASREDVQALGEQLDRFGLGGLMMIGGPGQRLLEIPVSEGRVGAIVIGGLNPMAILEETGLRVQSRALAGLIDFDRLFSYEELESRIRRIM
ncbi:MAG: DUF128 domain-containing protein [Proteobacteria bacterium]|nr:DUF128 domain-containing protein [Pseudomonadota bacterium]